MYKTYPRTLIPDLSFLEKMRTNLEVYSFSTYRSNQLLLKHMQRRNPALTKDDNLLHNSIQKIYSFIIHYINWCMEDADIVPMVL